MHLNKHIFLFTVLCGLFIVSTFFVSCASTGTTEKEPDPNFIANIDPFKVSEIQILSSKGKGELHPSTIEVDFNPQSNEVWFKTKVSIDEYLFLVNYEQRCALSDSMNTYLEMYASGNIPVQKPTKKNAISKGQMKIYWGVFGLAYEGDGDFFTNIEHVDENKPYFILDIGQAYDKESNAYSPLVRFYLTPSQIKAVQELLNQDTLVEKAVSTEEDIYKFE